jgi:hypothetical protein
MASLLLKFIIFSLYFINIQFFFIGNVAIKPIHFFGIGYLSVFLLRGTSFKNILKFLIVASIVLFGILNAVDVVEFWKSYVSFLLSLALLVFGPELISTFQLKTKINFLNYVFVSYKWVVFYGVIQFVMKNVFGSDLLYNNLGIFQYHPHYENELFGFSRATSLFYEPSVFGWVTNLIISSLVMFKEKIGMKKETFFSSLILYLIGLFVSLSSSAFASFFLLAFVYMIIKNRNKGIYIVFFLSIFFVGFALVAPYLRLSEISTENTSGYARVIWPFLNLLEVFEHYPISGRGLGQFGVEDNNLLYDGVIHNSVYGFMISFGLSSVILISFAIIRLLNYLKHDRLWLILWVCLFSIFSSTGSFLSLELPFVYLLIFTLFNVSKQVDIKVQFNAN